MSSVTFPSGLRVEGPGSEARRMTRHQCRESGFGIDKAVAGFEEATVAPGLAFPDIHNRAAGATLMGSLARGGYEYDGKATPRGGAAPPRSTPA